MDLIGGNIRNAYFKYLAAAFGSSFISCVYGMVDMAVVGQYHGPEGTAALAIVMPLWNVIYSLGLLMGIGGSVLMSTERGRGNDRTAHEYFSAAVIGAAALAAIVWVIIAFFDDPIFTVFGADDTLRPLAEAYVFPIKFAVPLFVINQALAAFLRNDGAPNRATAAVIAGGAFNVVGDIVFVFPCNMGCFGAGLATAIGNVITFLVGASHFLSKKCTLHFARPAALFSKLKGITVTGFSTFFSDLAMGIVTVLFNRQILAYLGTDALAVYGVIVNISTFVQCCAYSVGQAAQPLLSVNFGAKNVRNIRIVFRAALATAFAFGVLWLVLIFAVPNVFVRIFMTPTDAIYRIAPAILRTYGVSFILLPINVFSTYYFQAMMKPATSFGVSLARGCIISGALILALPALFGGSAVWLAMPITEALVFAAAAALMARCNARLPQMFAADTRKAVGAEGTCA